MVRFIFVCMTVVALSVLTMGGQFIMDGINNAQQEVAARNTPAVQAVETVAAQDNFSAEALNDIETAAGANFDPNDNFSGGFTNQAPKALADDDQTAPAPKNMTGGAIVTGETSAN